MEITTNPHVGGEHSLAIRGLDTHEQVDTYSVEEVEEIIGRLSFLVSEMKHAKKTLEMSREPTLWDEPVN